MFPKRLSLHLPALTRFFVLSTFLLGAASPALAQSRDPGSFYGFWQMQEPAGDQCVVNVKRGGRVSCFWTGSASSEVVKGRWTKEADQLIIAWESGYHDILTPIGDGALNRQAFQPGQDLDGPPAYETRAVRMDSRIPGSLTVDSSSPKEEEAPKPGGPVIDNRSSLTQTRPPETSVPARNPFVGYWKVAQNSGGVFGIGGGSNEHFYLFLKRNGQATVSLRSWDGNKTDIGTWELVDGAAQITWPSGQKDALVARDGEEYQLLSFNRKRTFEDRPESRSKARSVSATEAAQYFNAADIRMLTMTNIRGVWAVADPSKRNGASIVIEGWGNAVRHGPGENGKTDRGTWKLFNDHVIMTWEDGSKDVLRNDFRYWMRESFAPGMPITVTPSQTQIVVRVSTDPSDLSVVQ